MNIIPLALIAALGLPASARAQDTMPEAPGKKETLQLCSACHEAAKATSVKLTREGWIETIDRMKAFGASGSNDEFAAVLDYLAANFKGDTMRPLDMNTAESIDLESVLQLLRRESRAVLEYRARRGQLTSLDDLKGLDPVIFKKIEAKKDRIVFITQPTK
jgi:competence protein ComEA